MLFEKAKFNLHKYIECYGKAWCHRETGNVNDRPRSGRPSLITHRSDRLHMYHAKVSSFTSASQLR